MRQGLAGTWEGTAHREGVARPGLSPPSARLPLATRPEPMLSSLHRAPRPGSWSWE